MYLVKALDSYGYFALSEVFTTYFSEFGVSDVAAGTYYGAWGTAITAYGVATGFAIDAMGVRRSLVACYALQTLARLILAFTTNKTVAVVVLFTIQALATSWGAPVMTIAIKLAPTRTAACRSAYSIRRIALLSGVAIDLLRLVVPVSGFEFFGVSTPIRGWCCPPCCPAPSLWSPRRDSPIITHRARLFQSRAEDPVRRAIPKGARDRRGELEANRVGVSRGCGVPLALGF